MASKFKKWFMSMDQVILLTTAIIMAIGIWISIASTPAVAIKLGLQPFYFVKQHILLIPVAITLIISISFLKTKHIRLFAIIGYFACVVLVICTIIFGYRLRGYVNW